MTYRLFIDDERDPIDVTWGSAFEQAIYRNSPWMIARSYAEVMEIVLSLGMPGMISFDHDLGKNTPTGYDIAKRLVELAMDAPDRYSFPAGFYYLVHSKNPVGAENIRSYLNNYLTVAGVVTETLVLNSVDRIKEGE